MQWIGWVFVALGMFSIAGAIFNWDWFFNSRKAQRWVQLFGRGGARLVYLLIGLAFAVFGLCLAFFDLRFYGS